MLTNVEIEELSEQGMLWEFYGDDLGVAWGPGEKTLTILKGDIIGQWACQVGLPGRLESGLGSCNDVTRHNQHSEHNQPSSRSVWTDVG